MGLFRWFPKVRRKDEPQEEWWERTRRLESRMDACEIDCERMMGNVRRGLAVLGKRAQALDARDAGEQGSSQGENGARLTPQEEGRLLREYRAGKRA